MNKFTEKREWFLNELEESFPPCQMIRPTYAFGKQVVEFASDVVSLIAPIVIAFGYEVGSEIWNFLTSQQAKEFYARLLTEIVSSTVALYQFFTEVKSVCEVYVASDLQEREQMTYVVIDEVSFQAVSAFSRYADWLISINRESFQVDYRHFTQLIRSEIAIIRQSWFLVWCKQ